MSNKDQVGGDHYKHLTKDIYTITNELGLNSYQSNALKYLTRSRKKNGVEDVKKAFHCIRMGMEHAKAQQVLLDAFLSQFPELSLLETSIIGLILGIPMMPLVNAQVASDDILQCEEIVIKALCEEQGDKEKE